MGKTDKYDVIVDGVVVNTIVLNDATERFPQDNASVKRHETPPATSPSKELLIALYKSHIAEFELKQPEAIREMMLRGNKDMLMAIDFEIKNLNAKIKELLI